MADGQNEQVFELPGPQQRDPDPLADYKAYFAYWELQHLMKRKREREEYRSLSVYERARLKNY